MKPQQLHQPVLLAQTLDVLKPKKGENYLDLTAGFGGHAGRVIDAIGDAYLATLVDRDDFAIAALQPLAKAGARVIKSDYASAAAQLLEAGEQFDMILIDLGVSSPQLDTASRGFSFLHDGPLDMRMNQQTGQTAADICNKAPQGELVRILREYGEEPKAHKIAKAIIAARPLRTTAELAGVILGVHRGPWQKSHPATRTFQALRIAVNQELQQLDETLKRLPDLLKPGGRVVIISFHSLEDRMVKRFFKEEAEAGYEAQLQILTKQPISGVSQDVHNPRARSAKLRAAVKIK
jgi:16S rRNA (cytosine1402-N4)-methyltransferase